MNTRNFYRLMCCLIALLIILGCNYTSPSPTQVLDLNDLNTRVAGTFSAQLTISALNATPTSPPPEQTDTLQPPPVEATATPTSTPSPTLPEPSLTPFMSATPTPVPTATGTPILSTQLAGGPTTGGSGSSRPCLKAKFVEDVTVPDGSKFQPGKSFVKTWRIENTGSCAWTTDFSLVFVRGDRMSGPDALELSSRVDPGETVNLSVNLVAPVNAGDYRGHWMLEDDNGSRFGTGTTSNQTLWVDIEVKENDEGIVFSFVEAYCSAEWESDAGSLKCPGKEGDDSGFVILLTSPEQENRNENEPALWTQPEQVKDGWISGTYPAITVKNGYHFLADIGCLNEADKCDVVFQLNYRVGDGKVKKLGEWHEVYDGNITRVDINLGDLAGKSVQFILTVEANGSFKEDAAFWLLPQIFR